MGVVYKAEDTKLERTVALKFLASHLMANEEAAKRFTREAKAAAARYRDRGTSRSIRPVILFTN